MTLQEINQMKQNENQLMLGLRAVSHNQDSERNATLLYPDSNFKANWDLIVSLILLATCILTPLNFAFQDDLDQIAGIVATNYIIDILFFFDIIINFNSVVQDSQSNNISDRKEIAKLYLKGWFLIDVVSIFPFDLLFSLVAQGEEGAIGQNNELVRIARIGKLYKLIKITRLARLLKLAQNEGKLLKKIGGALKLG